MSPPVQLLSEFSSFMSYGQQILWHSVIIKISQLFLEKIATIMECTNKKSNLNCRIHFKRKSDLNIFHKKPAGHYIYQAEPLTNLPVLFWVCAACVLIDLNTVAKHTVFQFPILFEWLIMQQNNSHAIQNCMLVLLMVANCQHVHP